MNVPRLELPKRWRDPRYRIPYGYSPIPDSLRQWYSVLTVGEIAVIHVISYHTWKFKRKARAIAQSQFSKETSLARSTISRSILSLEEKNLIIVMRQHRKPSIYELNPITKA